MIARIWRGRTRAEHAAEYAAYIRRTGVEALRASPGNQGTLVLRRVAEGEAEFYVISLWESMDDIRKFAGEEYEVPVYFPEDGNYLLEKETRVRHYDLTACELDGPTNRPSTSRP
jgi:heme-degrading monooxygenase HmoA